MARGRPASAMAEPAATTAAEPAATAAAVASLGVAARRPRHRPGVRGTQLAGRPVAGMPTSINEHAKLPRPRFAPLPGGDPGGAGWRRGTICDSGHKPPDKRTLNQLSRERVTGLRVWPRTAAPAGRYLEMSGQPEDALEVLREVWSAQGQTSTDLADALGTKKSCK